MYRRYRNDTGSDVLLPETIFDQMKAECQRYYPRESGGVLIGHIQDGSTAVIDQMIMPRRFFSTRIFFSRPRFFINRQLKRIWEESKGQTFYLGDWHCHPNMSSRYSLTDYKAMVSIASNPDIKMKTPILIIVGYSPPEYSETVYVLMNGQLKVYDILDVAQ
jgi:integrative and conjugative element protein (TIGR02256 family)